MSYDTWKTTEPDPHPEGVPCELCSAPAFWVPKIQGEDHPVPLCDTCAHDHVTDCPECGAFFYQAQGTRIEGTTLHCPKCASSHPAVVGDVMAGILADEQQDEFNRTRR